MTQQNKEDRPVPTKPPKDGLNPNIELLGGGKAIPVNQQMRQLTLWSEPVEGPEPNSTGADGRAANYQKKAVLCAVPLSDHKGKKIASATMDGVTSCLREAFRNVASNKGAPGPDRQSIAEVGEILEELLPILTEALLKGTYRPGNIRRVWIPKSGGGQRGLGIPNVVDRMVSEAIRLVLEPRYEPTFHSQSHGFRPGRSCHTAISEARRHVAEGYDMVVDLDLEKFFDRVHHQRLMARLAERVSDRGLLVLIGQMLKAKVELPNGVLLSPQEGVPQGGPLSPLLSNIVLDELDAELVRRGHRFVRYADDVNIYVRSERAGQRVMASVVRFIERRMRLKVNTVKSAVAPTEERHFLGFQLRLEPTDGSVEVHLSKRSQDQLDRKIQELTPRNWGSSLRACIRSVNAYVRGWCNFFGICTVGIERTLQSRDAHIRRRLRAIQLRHWKRHRTIARKLIGLGVRRTTAWRSIYRERQSWWALSHNPAVERGLRNAYFAERGLISLAERWQAWYRTHVAPVSIQLDLGLG